jgi:hypothetical protein
MRSKSLSGMAALALTVTAVVAAGGPASAERWHHGWGPVGLAAGVVGGAVAAATSPWGPGYYDGYDYAPGNPYDNGYAYEPSDEIAPAYTYMPGGGGGQAAGYCAQRYRSYDPSSGTYLGYDGVRHPCP